MLSEGLGRFTDDELRHGFTRYRAQSEFMPTPAAIIALIKLRRQDVRDVAEIEKTRAYLAELRHCREMNQLPENQEAVRLMLAEVRAKIFGSDDEEYSGS